jgi:hypothetical protein
MRLFTMQGVVGAGVGDTVGVEYVSRVPRPPLDGCSTTFTTWRVRRRTPG